MKRVVLLMAALALATAACGGGNDDDAASAAANGSTEVTIAHRYGTTTLDARPERIVALDNQWLDVLTALDAPVVGAALDPYVDGGRYPWQQLPDDVEGITIGDQTIPYEAVAAARPDLIVVTFMAQDEVAYETLSDIAPTIPLLGEEQVDAWEDIAATAGEVLGMEDEAAALVEQADADAAALADELAGLDGKTYAMANYVPGDAIYVIADPEDGAARLFGKLGLSIDPDILAIADGEAGRATISLERVDELDADLLLLLTNDADPNEIPGYAALPAVQDGATAVIAFDVAVALNTPSPLSIPYALEEIRAALDAAAA